MKKTLITFGSLAITLSLASFCFATGNGNGNSGDCQGATCSSQIAQNSDGTSSSVQSSNSGSSTQNQTQSETQVQNRENNPGTGTMTEAQIQDRVREELQTSKPEYAPQGSSSQKRANDTEEIVENLLTLSVSSEDATVATKLKNIAQTYVTDIDKANKAFDKSDQRTSFAKFFVGPNYKQLKETKTVMEQNRNRIREMKQIKDQLQNDSDKLELANQIIALQDQNVELEKQIDSSTQGFSLFGWLNKLITKF